VLIVEEHAHWAQGHYPNRFVELADAYTTLGYRVEILTARGAGDASPAHPVHRFTRSESVIARAANWLQRPHGGRRNTVVQRWGHALGMTATAIAIRHRARTMDPAPDAVVVLGLNTDPTLVAALAGPGNLLLYQFGAPSAAHRWKHSTTRHLTNALARRNVTRHRAAGTRVRLSCAHPAWRDEWSSQAPFLDPITLPIAGTRPFTPEPDARHQLDDGSGRRTALLFGTGANTDRTTALEAFAEINGWRLVLAGTVAGRVDASALPPTISIAADTTVDESTRNRLFSAADLVVLSFTPDYWNDSGVLMDAISAGVPVVCSERSSAATLVRDYRLGTTFPAGDVDALRRAVREALESCDADGLARARADLSNLAVARRQLDALGVTYERG
jgi:hypothetical protein